MKRTAIAVGLLALLYLSYSAWSTYDYDCRSYPINDLADLAKVFIQARAIRDRTITQRHEMRWCFALGRFVRTLVE